MVAPRREDNHEYYATIITRSVARGNPGPAPNSEGECFPSQIRAVATFGSRTTPVTEPRREFLEELIPNART